MVERLGYDVTVTRDNELDLSSVERFDKLIISPGPGLPFET